MPESKPSLLLIDDNKHNLEALRARLAALLDPDEAELRTWVPSENDGPPAEAFDAQVDENTALVITDYDLTTSQRAVRSQHRRLVPKGIDSGWRSLSWQHYGATEGTQPL